MNRDQRIAVAEPYQLATGGSPPEIPSNTSTALAYERRRVS